MEKGGIGVTLIAEIGAYQIKFHHRCSTQFIRTLLALQICSAGGVNPMTIYEMKTVVVLGGAYAGTFL